MHPNLDPAEPFDVIIAGGGASGCVLASRLSADPQRRVLLVEAGLDAAAPGAEDAEVRDAYPVAMSHPALRWWNVTAELGRYQGDTPVVRPFATGRGVGGGSNVNGMAADRGQPSDYDEWEELGAEGWNWENVLEFFKKAEHDLDYTGPNAAALHGGSGPMPVRRLSPRKWGPFAGVLARALARRGFAEIEDYMSDFREGFGPTPTNSLPSGRVSAAMAYLDRDVRARRNLTILSGTLVDRVEFDSARAIGVWLIPPGGSPTLIRAAEVIVSCGGVHSAAVLQRSGIGPAAHLAEKGVPIVSDRPGVGENLFNHPYVILTAYLPPKAQQAADNLWMCQHWLRYSSKVEGCKPNDMHIMPFNKTAWHAIGNRVAATAVTVLQPLSAGSVRLKARDPSTPPDIRFNMFDDPRDFERLVAGTRLALELLCEKDVAEMRREMFLPDPKVVASLARPNRKNALKAKIIAALLEIGPLRRHLMRKAIFDPHALLKDDGALRDFVRRCATIQLHECGTCRMGRTDDPLAVVDPSGRVIGVQGLRVVDASIFPTVPRGYTHYITLMVAEKLSEDIIRQAA